MDDLTETAFSDPDLAALLRTLKERVEERRSRGDYPPGLEQDLDAHFRSIVRRGRAPYDPTTLPTLLAEVRRTAAFSPDEIAYDSSIPGGAAFHRAVAKVASRQTQGLLQQFQAFADATRDLLTHLVESVGNPSTHVHTDLLGQIDLALDRLSSYEATPEHPAVADAELRRRIELLEAIEERRDFRPWFSSTRFDEAFRGSRDELVERYADLARSLTGCDPVVDIGCGRGEFIQLLLDQGVDARGIELDLELVKDAEYAELPVTFGDAVTWLRAQPEASLGGIAMIQVIEHLTAQEAIETIALAASRLRAGGRMIVETVNPQSLYVFAHSFYLDPTHATPVHPAYLHFLFREAGFREVAVDWRSPPPDGDVLSTDMGLSTDAVERLNRLLFAPQDYAVIATR